MFLFAKKEGEQMANETQIGQLVIDLKTKTESLEKGLETAKKKLQEIEDQNEQVKKSNKGLDASFMAMAVGIVAALSKVKSAINSGVDAYKEYESASKGLESIVKGQGLSFNNAQNFIKDYISDGLIPLSDATLAYKNLAARGYNQEQIETSRGLIPHLFNLLTAAEGGKNYRLLYCPRQNSALANARSGDYFILLCFPRPKLTFSADAGGDVRRFDVFSPPTPSFWEANRRGLTQDAALFPACSVSSPRHKAGKTLNCLVFPARISILGSSKAGMILSGFVIPRHETALAADAGGDVK